METQNLANSAAAGLFAGIGLGMIMIAFAIGIFILACYWKIFVKAGKPGWACIIPIYNIIVLLEIVNKPWWWLLLMCIPFVNIIIIIMVVHRISLSFGKGAGFTLGLLFISIVFVPILAFDNSTYTKLVD